MTSLNALFIAVSSKPCASENIGMRISDKPMIVSTT